MQLPLFDTPCSWQPPDLSSLPSWAGAKRIAYDVETRDPQLKELGLGAGRRKDSYVVGRSFAIEDGPAFYLPTRHHGGGNLPEENVVRYLRDQAATYTGELAGTNLSYDLDYSAEEGIHFPMVRRFRDVQIAEALIYELHDSYSLESISKRWGLEGKRDHVLNQALANYGLKVNSRKDLWKLPARFAGEYGMGDVYLPLHILRRQERVLEEDDLWRVYDIESQLLPILTKMRRLGVRVNMQRLEAIERWSYAKESEALEVIRHHSGVTIPVGDVWKPEVVAKALVAIGYTPPLTSQGRPSIDKDSLKGLKHPVGDAIARARKVNKLRTSFAASIRAHLTPDGRIHCTYNQVRHPKEDEDDDEQAGGRYGRVSCEHPNLQQQPSRDEFAPAWRSIYLPEEGEMWAAADYSQQEPRMTVHYACLSRHLIGYDPWLSAIKARDQYRNNPNTDNHQMMADMTGLKRRVAKDIFLGLCYGMGGAKLCRALGLPTRWVVRGPTGAVFDVQSAEGKALAAQGARRWEAAGPEGQALLDRFDQAVPFVRKLAWAAERRARSVGYVMTISGRRCHFPKDAGGNFDWTHKALNRIIQGSSGDQMKIAMIELDKAGFRMLLQIHDENGLSVKSHAEAEQAAVIMRECCPIEVPSKVDLEEGESWGVSMLEAMRAKAKDEKSKAEFDLANEVFMAIQESA